MSIAIGGAALVDPATLVSPSGVLPLTGVTAVAITTVRRAVRRSEKHARAALDKLVRQLEAREQQLAAREEALARREKLVDQTVATTNLRIWSAHARLDQALDDRARERHRVAELESEYRELARDYNALALEAAQHWNPSTAHHPPLAVGQTGNLPAARGPRRNQRRGPHAPLEVVNSEPQNSP
ncbi:hypothetical protein [Streptomyces werraensis]|uniref:hypothetical protein n=1 Tax=Streptomyces werraensis TaxID=68284 RepID=UPI0037D7169C